MNNKTPADERRGYQDGGRLSESPTPNANTKSQQVNFWAEWRGTQFMAPKGAWKPLPAHTHFQMSLFNPNGWEPVVHLIPEREFYETLGMTPDAARFAGLIERSAQIAGERFYRPAPEVRP